MDAAELLTPNVKLEGPGGSGLSTLLDGPARSAG